MPKAKKAANKPAPVLVISDLHEPFTHEGYLDFCLRKQGEYGCGSVVFLGDVVDNHALSFHDHDPSGRSAGDELELARFSLAKWHRKFPNAKVCIGNHDARAHIRAFKYGIPRSILRSLREIYDTPSWDYQFRHEIGGVLYLHGTRYSGMTAHRRIAMENRQSTVIGHIHAHAGVCYLASHLDLIFGMNAGCGIDENAYAMDYGKDFQIKPVVGCGVVVSRKEAYFIPMDLGDKR